MVEANTSAELLPSQSVFHPRTVALFIVLLVIAGIYLFYLPQ